MTIIFSIAMPNMIVMSADSAITKDFGETREYEVGGKSYFYPGIGCVTTWGARDGNRISEHLSKRNLSSSQHSVEDLALFVWEYLTMEYRPDQMNLDDVGYHIAGFDKQGQARLFHYFYGFDQPRKQEQENREYKNKDHTPPNGNIQFLYNGRNDIAEVVVYTMIHQIINGIASRFHPTDPFSMVRFADFVCRVGAELTQEVGPPFVTHIISSHNVEECLRNDSLSPIDQLIVEAKLKKLGIEAHKL